METEELNEIKLKCFLACQDYINIFGASRVDRFLNGEDETIDEVDRFFVYAYPDLYNAIHHLDAEEFDFLECLENCFERISTEHFLNQEPQISNRRRIST